MKFALWGNCANRKKNSLMAAFLCNWIICFSELTSAPANHQQSPSLCFASLHVPRWSHDPIQAPWEWKIPSSWTLPFVQDTGSKSQVLPLPLNAAFRSKRFLITLMLSLGFLYLPLQNRRDCLWSMLLCAQLQQRHWKGSSVENPWNTRAVRPALVRAALCAPAGDIWG